MTKNWYEIEQKYLPGISNTKRHISNILHFSTWNAWKISPYFLVLIFTPSAFAFPLYIRSWYFGVSKNHIWSLQKCIFDKRYVHPNGTSGNFQNIEFFENPNFFSVPDVHQYFQCIIRHYIWCIHTISMSQMYNSPWDNFIQNLGGFKWPLI